MFLTINEPPEQFYYIINYKTNTKEYAYIDKFLSIENNNILSLRKVMCYGRVYQRTSHNILGYCYFSFYWLCSFTVYQYE